MPADVPYGGGGGLSKLRGVSLPRPMAAAAHPQRADFEPHSRAAALLLRHAGDKRRGPFDLRSLHGDAPAADRL